MRISALVPENHPLLLTLKTRTAQTTFQEMLSLLLEPGSALAEVAIDGLIARRRDDLLRLVVGQDSDGVVDQILANDKDVEAARDDVRRLTAAAAALSDPTREQP